MPFKWNGYIPKKDEKFDFFTKLREREDVASQDSLRKVTQDEAARFQEAYLWLEREFPKDFWEESDPSLRSAIARGLLSFSLQEEWIEIRLPKVAIVGCVSGKDAELRILEPFGELAISYFHTFIAKKSWEGKTLRIGILYFRGGEKETGLSPRFVNALGEEKVESALQLLEKAKEKDSCQIEVKRETNGLELTLAWRGVPKGGFLYRLAQVIHAHHFSLHKCAATYLNPHSPQNVLLLALELEKEGAEGDLNDFIRELELTKYFAIDDPVGSTFVQTGLLTGNEGHFVRNCISFVHQMLVHADPNLYSLRQIVEDFCRHPELTCMLAKAFKGKFEPKNSSLALYEKTKEELLGLLEQLDTGQPINDIRRKEVLRQGLLFIDAMLKTNFYTMGKSSFSFRLDPSFLEQLPYGRAGKFPEIPFAIFFIRGMHFIGFHVRFRDLARGGVRTILPKKKGGLSLRQKQSLFRSLSARLHAAEKK